MGTALDLFIRDKDPVSVHCLACGGGEVIEGIAHAQRIAPFSSKILQVQPSWDERKLKGVRNQYWNAFKHLMQRDGKFLRDDRATLESFSDLKNDTALFVGWHDYVQITGALPVAAQVFQLWWYALNEERLSPDADLLLIRNAFPRIMEAPRPEQKRQLRRSVEKWSKSKSLLSDPKTERRLQVEWNALQ